MASVMSREDEVVSDSGASSDELQLPFISQVDSPVSDSATEISDAPMVDMSTQDIAIVGFDVRLPQDATSPTAFWNMMMEGRNASTEVPADRANMNAFYHPNSDRTDTTNVRRGHFVTGDMSAFDAPFFSIQPLEAESMDPQQRILLETSYRALENAGMPIETVSGSDTGVYVAASTRDFEAMLYRDSDQLPKYFGTGVGSSLMSNRISWFFNFKGQSLSIDTACSGSLVALHNACQALKAGDMSMALVAGVSLILAPEICLPQLSTLGFLSPDGRSYSFDSRANGYGKGEGVTVVILKRVKDALRDGDPIRAIIRNTSVNQDGRTPGITQPSKDAQLANILRAYQDLDLEDTQYFEAHGTGTPVGDPIEAEAIYKAFRRSSSNPLYIGSVKSNIGHLEAGAGLAALVKSTLCLEKGIVPSIADFHQPNPSISMKAWGLEFLGKAKEFPNGSLKRVSINSFGYGGTNGHAILESKRAYFHQQAESKREIPTLRQHDAPVVLVLSAMDEEGVSRIAKQYDAYFQGLKHDTNSEVRQNLLDLAHTLSSRRSNLPWKSFAVLKEAESRLEVSKLFTKPVRSSNAPSISLVFTGQGAQWQAMCKGLEVHKTFFTSLCRSRDDLLSIGCEWDLVDELLHKTSETSRIDAASFSQPLCTALQIALVDFLYSMGIVPAAVVGHSSGEIAAAYACGAICQRSAMKLSYFRGLAIEKNVKRGEGSMMAVAMTPEQIQPYLNEVSAARVQHIAVGCVNAASNLTITGSIDCIEDLRQKLDSLGIFARKLNVDVAYHSEQMLQAADAYASELGELKSGSPQSIIKMISSVTGLPIELEQLRKPQYWVDNLVGQVKFEPALRELLSYLNDQRQTVNKTGRDILIEVGPTAALQRPIKDILTVNQARDMTYDNILLRTQSSGTSFAEFSGRMRCQGVNLDMAIVSGVSFPGLSCKILTDLPGYVFNHSTKYWDEGRISQNFRHRKYPRHDLIGLRDPDWNVLQPKWRNLLRINEHPWLQDHRLDGSNILPASWMVTMALEGSRQLAKDADVTPTGYRVQNVVFERSFPIPDDAPTAELELRFDPSADSSADYYCYRFQVCGLVNGVWNELCHGTVETIFSSNDADERNEMTRLGFKETLEEPDSSWSHQNAESFYSEIEGWGYTFGPTFQTLEDVRSSDSGEGKAKVPLKLSNQPQRQVFVDDFLIHPVELDALFQVVAVGQTHGGQLAVPVLIPAKIQSLWISARLDECRPEHSLQGHAIKKSESFRESAYTVAATDGDRVDILMDNFRLTHIASQALQNLISGPSKKLNYNINWQPDLDLLSEQEASQFLAERNDEQRVAEVVGLLAHKTPGCGILEYSGHAAEASKSVLTRLRQSITSEMSLSDVPLYRSYTYTTPVPEQVTESPEMTFPNVTQEAFDINGDLSAQGFADKQFEIVLWSSLSESDDDLSAGLLNIRQILKTGGHLILSGRSDISKTKLSEQGFANIKQLSKNLLICSAEQLQSYDDRRIAIIMASESERQSLVANGLEQWLATQNAVVSRHSIVSLQAESVKDQTCIFLNDLDDTYFDRVNDERWLTFKAIVYAASKTFWISQSGRQGSLPGASGMVTGIGRNIHCEFMDQRFVHVLLEQESSTSSIVSHVTNVLQATPASRQTAGETEFREQRGRLCIGRLMEASDVNAEIHGRIYRRKPEAVSWPLAQPRNLELTIVNPGVLDSLAFQDDLSADLPIQPHEIEVETRAGGVNFKDVLIAMGNLAGSKLGFECAGIVTKAGSASGFAVGDKVACCSTAGVHKTRARVDSSSALRMAEHLSFCEASAIPIVFGTAYYALITLANLQADETVLIHAAAGGVGQAAIQLAQRCGAKIFVTVGSQEKRQLIRDLYEIPDEHIFNSRTPDFAKQVLELVPSGVDVVLNSLKGRLQEVSWQCIAPLGRFLEIGKADIENPKKTLSMSPFAQNVSFHSIDLGVVMSKAKPLMRRIMTAVEKLFQEPEGLKIPYPLQVYNLGQMSEAFRALGSGKTSGKLVLDFGSKATVSVAPSIKPAYQFDGNASYVISGGFGGLGREIMKWMISRGARYFLVLSRSGPVGEENQTFLRDLSHQGVVLQAPRCDITNREEIAAALATSEKPIRGCIQAAMVIKDALFDNQTADSFNACVLAKSHGTANLASLLPHSMDFFVFLSSIASVTGSRGQINYSAGNNFQDELARELVAQGRKCVSLNLGSIKAVGYAAEKNLTAQLRAEGFEGMSPSELLAMLEYACDPACPISKDVARCQLVSGLASVEMMSAANFQQVYWTQKPMMRTLVNLNAYQDKSAGLGGSAAQDASHWGSDLVKAESVQDAVDIVVAAVCERIAGYLGIPAGDVETRKRLDTFGIDSLTALELRYWVGKEMDSEISVFEILGAEGVYDLALLIEKRCKLRHRA